MSKRIALLAVAVIAIAGLARAEGVKKIMLPGERGDAIRAVEYSGYTVNYCPTCQTGGKVLADNTTSKFLK